jgi:hypothetical protein
MKHGCNVTERHSAVSLVISTVIQSASAAEIGIAHCAASAACKLLQQIDYLHSI